MRLLHVNSAYRPFVGGAEAYIEAMSERAAAEGHTVTVATTDAAEVEYFWNPRKRRVEAGHERLNGVEVVRSPVRHLPGSPWSFYLLRRCATAIAAWPQAARPLLRRLAPWMPYVPGHLAGALEGLAGGFDLVHGMNISVEWPLLAAWRYARRHRLPFVATPFVHVGEPGRRDVLRNYVMPHQMDALRDADAVIVQTEIERETLAGMGVAATKLHRLGMGVDLQRLTGGDGQRFRARYGLSGPLVTFLGVVTYDKGCFHLVRALERLWTGGWPVHLVLAGPTVDEFEQFWRRLSPQTRACTLRLGPVVGPDKQDLLAATDVLVLPSRIDSFGIVVLEAWAYGKPVIGARAGGLPAVIKDEVDGLLVPFGDVMALARAIERLLADPGYRQALGRRGRAKVEANYTWERIYGGLRAIYERLVS